MTAPFDFLPGTQHTFAFCLPGGHLLWLNAETVHSERIGPDAVYHVGFSFLLNTSEDSLTLAVLVDVAKGSADRRTLSDVCDQAL